MTVLRLSGERASGLREADTGMRPGNDHLRLIEERCGIGTWQLDVPTGAMRFSTGLFHILGLDPQLLKPSASAIETLVHPDDRHLEHGFESCSRPRSLSYRVIRPDGDLRWLANFAQPVRDRSGRIVQIAGVLADITEARLAETDALVSRAAMTALAGAVSVHAGISDAVTLQAELNEPSELALSPGSPFVLLRRLAATPEDFSRVLAAWKATLGAAQPLRLTFPGARGVPMVCHCSRLLPGEGAGQNWLWIVAERRHFDIVVDEDESGAEPLRLSPAEIRCARGYLDWTAQALAKRSGLSFSTIRRLEATDNGRCRPSAMTAIRATFERAGVSFDRDADGRVRITFARRGEPCPPNRPGET